MSNEQEGRQGAKNANEEIGNPQSLLGAFAPARITTRSVAGWPRREILTALRSPAAIQLAIFGL